MNPNDALIQMVWAHVQACLGDAERGLPAAELSLRHNPRCPRYYDHFHSRVLFLTRRHAEARAVLEWITIGDPLHHPRDLGWWAAACGHLRREEEARRCAEWCVQAMRKAWHGNPAAGPAEYVDWLVDRSYLRRAEDAAHLRACRPDRRHHRPGHRVSNRTQSSFWQGLGCWRRPPAACPVSKYCRTTPPMWRPDPGAQEALRATTGSGAMTCRSSLQGAQADGAGTSP